MLCFKKKNIKRFIVKIFKMDINVLIKKNY